jgi:acyl-CoA synthetase (NDP forming)
VDVAFIAINAARILQTIEDYARKQTCHLICFRFAEVGGNSKRLQNQALKMSSEYCFLKHYEI